MFCTKITSRLKHISDKLAKFERIKAILVEYIKSEQHLNGAVWQENKIPKKDTTVPIVV